MLRILRAKKPSKKLSIKRLTKVFQISRSTIYYRSKGERQENLRIMELIEEIYRKDPTLGWRRIKVKVEKYFGVRVNHKRIKRLMQKMGLKGICPRKRRRRIKIKGKPNLLPYFLPFKPNRVWAMDITYVKVDGGFAYGVTVMDLYSRKILSFKLSNTQDEEFCIEAVREAIDRYGVPEVVHTDKGSQFMGSRFRTYLENLGIRISYGEKGFKDNVYVERFWRSYKWECVYLREKMDLKGLREVSKEWIEYYNRERPHQGCGYRTPDEMYYEGLQDVQKLGYNENEKLYV